MKPYKMSFRVKWVFFDAIKRGTKTREIRRANPFWNKRCQRAQIQLREATNYPVSVVIAVIAVFTSGPHVHKRRVTDVHLTNSVIEALGHTPTDVEKACVGEGPYWVICLGEVVE